MSTAPLEPPLSPDLPAWVRRGALAVICLLLLAPALRILGGLPIYGDDHSSHLAGIHHLLRLLRAGETDLFCPTFNLGFPMYLYYQPLPHAVAALLHLGSLGLLGEQAAFNLTVVALWCAYPLACYAGARRLGLGDTAALLAAAAAPAVRSSLGFGFTLDSVMGLGLYTQLYAMVLFPLCLGWSWHALHRADGAGARPLLAASGLHVLVWLSHAFYGVAAATAAALMVAARPGRLRRALPRLGLIGALTLASLLFWLLPLARTDAFAGGWPWDGVDRWEGYGASRVLRALLRGQLLDERQLPILSFALTGGLALAALRLRRSAVLRALALCFLVFLLFVIGRRSLGFLVDLQPANRGLQLFRYIGPLHACAVLLAGAGLAWLAERASRWVGSTAALALCACLLLPPTVGLVLRARYFFHTIRSYHITDRDLAAAGEAIREARGRGTPAGRVYAHNKAGTGAHLVAAAMALHTEEAMGQSYGLSMHDALGFYYLEHLDPLDGPRRALFNFRFALAAPDSTLARGELAAGNRPLLRRPTLLVFQLPGEHRYLQPVDLSLALLGAPRELRPAALAWLTSGWPAAGQFGIAVRDPAQAPAGAPILRGHGKEAQRLEDGTWRPLAQLPPPPARGAPGRVLEERIALNRYSGRVEMTRAAAVVLKVGYHPFWQARVDGARVPSLLLTPSYLGVRVPAGVHDVELRFRNPLYQKVLFLLALILWLTIAGWRCHQVYRNRSRKA